MQDSTIKIWDTTTAQLSMTLSGHTQSVTCVKWGGEGLIYSASQDRTIKVWKAETVSPVWVLFYNKLPLLPKCTFEMKFVNSHPILF